MYYVVSHMDCGTILEVVGDVKKLWKIFAVWIENCDVTSIGNDVIKVFQHVQAILCNILYALNHPYLHYTYATLTWAHKCN